MAAVRTAMHLHRKYAIFDEVILHCMMQMQEMATLNMDGVPLRRLIGYCHGGIGMHVSNLKRQQEKDVAAFDESIQTTLKNPAVLKMVVLDDFNEHHPYLLKHIGGAHAQCNVGNAILKDVTDTGVDLPVAVYGDSLLPRSFSPDLFATFFDRVLASGHLRGSYMDERSHAMEEWSRVVRPYGARRIRHPHSPVTLDGVQLLLSSSEGFHKYEEIEKVLQQVMDKLAPYLADRLMVLTGDWHTFWVVFRLVRLHPEIFGHLVPLPGAFHIGLNAQQAIFKWYSPIVTILWGQVSDTIVPLPLRPLQRKNVLDLLCRAWRQCRRSIVPKIAAAKCGRDVIMLLHFFEEVLPVTLDVYSAFLDGDADLFEALLIRLLPIFAQFGKQNYVHALVLFVVITEHWRTNFREMHQKYRKAFNRFSEEEIELFHSTVRPCTNLCHDSEQLAARISVRGKMRDTVAEWNEALGVPEGGGGLCREWFADQEGKMKSAIVSLFEAAMTAPDPTVQMGKEGWEWISPTFSAVNDRAYPLGLQKQECVYGLHYVDMSHEKIDIGSDGLAGAALHLSGCGHPGRRGALCPACCIATRRVAVEVLEALRA
jgi:hypothetical protein